MAKCVLWCYNSRYQQIANKLLDNIYKKQVVNERFQNHKNEFQNFSSCASSIFFGKFKNIFSYFYPNFQIVKHLFF